MRREDMIDMDDLRREADAGMRAIAVGIFASGAAGLCAILGIVFARLA